LENCIVCGKPLSGKHFSICKECLSKGWIDCSTRLTEKRKQIMENASKVLTKFTEK